MKMSACARFRMPATPKINVNPIATSAYDPPTRRPFAACWSTSSIRLPSQVRALHEVVAHQLCRCSAEDHGTGLHDVGIRGHAERFPGVLFDQQHRDPLFSQHGDDLKDEVDSLGSEAQGGLV